MSNKQPKYPLSIRLAESVVFLRDRIDPGRSHRRRVNNDGAPPAMLRGLLTLHLSKPTRISSIEVLLEGKSTIQWPQANGSRRPAMPEEHTILSVCATFFDAKSCISSNRSASVGPDSHDSHGDSSHYDGFHPRSPSVDHPAPRSSLHLGLHNISSSPPERRSSTGEYQWQRDIIAQDHSGMLSVVNLLTPPVSPPYTPARAITELPVVSRPQTPTDSHQVSSHPRVRTSRSEDNPGQMLEEFRSALRMEMEGSIRPTESRTSIIIRGASEITKSPGSSRNSLSAMSAVTESAPGSRSSSPRPAPTSELGLSGYYARTSSPSSSPASSSFHQLPASYSPEHEFDHSQTRGNRPSSRWSLSNVSNVFKDAKEKFRSVSKEPDPERGRTQQRGHSDSQHLNPPITNDDGDNKRREKERKSTLSKLTAVVGRDESSHIENWKEFRRGTYTYPISFAIPSNTPPTVHCDFGAIIYRLKAVVHRPGPLTSKLAAMREVTFVASPADDTEEETHSIVVERQWDTQLRYLITLGGRSFVIGSQVPFSLTMIPMAKCKIHRLSVVLEEKVEYYLSHQKMVREQGVQTFELLSIKVPSNTNPSHILPLDPEHTSILSPYLDTSSPPCTVDEALSSLMGPGPWVLTHDLRLPTECGKIHFTYRHKRSNISISHILKIVFRVERGDEEGLNLKTGKRRLFDIVIQTPIHILSCYCDPLWTTLPGYALFGSKSDDHSLGTSGPTCACSGGAGQSLATDSLYQISPLGTPSNSRPPTREQREQAISNINEFTPMLADGVGMPVQHPPHFADSSYQFARLMSGQESVFGDSPPQYQALSA